MRPIAILAILPVAALGASLAIAASPGKLTKAQAQAIALRVAPGKVAKAEYEKEDGAWRYSFDIRQGKRIHEIGVDPNTGKIIENSFESAGDKD
ncbi:peptidase YpeB-like protein [Hephaestia caeni]|uniref:Peptidase YpeB-like protein n=1 Tax=Hephaestia caeni TaxID=645617 RepID=A0A397PI13_9SPHN|nr:PepSY domain-containing protein [Hephaestia caeni]RIA45774.1 peptidase YpeB-like protein [Hephaestia caeni]